MFGHATDNDVISLESRRAAGARPDCFTALDAHWTELADGRIMPHRDDVDPRALAAILDHCFLLEQIAPGMARVRFAGQALSAPMGMDIRGMPVSALFTPSGRIAVGETLSALFDEPARCELVVQGQRQALRGRMAGQMLLLPLRDRDGDVTRAIGCLSLSGGQGAAPLRLDVIGEQRTTLLGYGTRPDEPAPHRGDSLFDKADTARDRSRHRQELRAKLTVVTGDLR